MNDLLQRYLAAVERRLPSGDAGAKAKAADIVAELREVLLSKIEAKEEALGREATNDEVAEVLKGFGHPVVVASRYGGHDYVIGPNYYPWFWHVQRVAVGGALVIGFGIATVRGLGSDEPMRAAMRGLGSAVEIALIVFGVVTALFIAAERGKLDLKWSSKWDPQHLPRDNIREPKSVFETGVTLAADILFLLWWTKVVSFPAEIPAQDGRSVAFAFSPAWEAVYWPILALAVGSALVHAADLIHPPWSRARSLASIAGHLAGLGIILVLSQAQPLVAATPVNGAEAGQVERLFRLVDGIVQVSLVVTAVIWVVAIAVEVRRLWRTRGGSHGSSKGGPVGGSPGSQQVVI